MLKKNDPLVSAIITTHDREPEIVLRAVKSVLDQTYQNIELIVVDDSSPSFAKRAEVEQAVLGVSDAILYLKHDFSQGACAARNTGLHESKGYYVGFLDDDDEWLPTKIEMQLKGFCDDKIALVYGRIILLDEKTGRAYIRKAPTESGYIFESLLKSCYIGSTSNPLIKKECIEAVGEFDVQMEACQDYDLWLRLALRYPMQFIDAPVLRYHIHPGIRISKNTEKKIQGYERINRDYAAYINKDDDIWYMRHRALIPYYLELYGVRKSLTLWISWINERPGCFLGKSKLFFRIVLRSDLILRLVGQYRMLRGDRRE